MAATTINKPVSPLAEYLIDVLYLRWSSDRQDLDLKWERNDCAIRKIRTGKWKEGEGEGWRANNFIGVLKQKWLAGTALVLDHVLEGGVLNAGLKVNEMWEDLSTEQHDEHADDIDNATRQIHTMFALGKIDKTTIKTVLSMGKYGMAWATYYVDTVRRVEWQPVEHEFEVADAEDQRFERVVHEIETPMVEWVPVWEMFWDMTEDDIHKGDGLCREQNITAYKLRENAESGEGWIAPMIEEVIEDSKTSDNEGEGDDGNIAPGKRYLQYSKNSIKFREFRCRVPKKILFEYQKSFLNERAPDFDGGFDTIDETDGNEQEILCVVANNRVVRFLPVDDETDLRKFYRVKWEDDLDHEQGVGIADNGEQAQEILNGAVNAFQDNKKLSGDIQGFYAPMHFNDDEDMTIQPGKFRPTSATTKDASQAVHQLVFEDTGESLISVIRLSQEFLDDETNIPKSAQGSIGALTPKTAYEASQLAEKSGKYIASVIRNVDNDYTEPITNDFFEFIMMDPNSTITKGNYVAIAKGFTSFQDKVVRVQKLMQVLNLVLSNETVESMTRVMKLLEEILRANDIDPDEVLYSEEDYLANLKAEREAAIEAEKQVEESKNDPEAEELDKEKTAAEIAEIEQDGRRKDAELQLKKAEAEQEGRRKDEELQLKRVELELAARQDEKRKENESSE
jgi:hypothetical protein